MKLLDLTRGAQIAKLIPEWEEIDIEATVTIPLPDGFEFSDRYMGILTGAGWTVKGGVLSLGANKPVAKQAAKKKGND